MVRKVSYILLLVNTLLLQCSFEKEVNIALPEYANTPYIECYLEPGKPYRLLAYYSQSYFASLTPAPIRDAEISVVHQGVTIAMPYDTIPRVGDIRFYNYRSNDSSLVPAHYNELFNLMVKINGVTYSSVTTIYPAVPIDTLSSNCNANQRCQLEVHFRDDPSTTDYYRYISFSDSLGGDVKQDYIFNDKLFDTENTVIGGGYSFNEGQKVVVRLYHITKDYYDFLTS
ncbi:MAG TPA: DUF4249 family protein, partial [Cytophagaceae bacterium]|nr:DUF4249 family protein [Cytophagaceae bacterium]